MAASASRYSGKLSQLNFTPSASTVPGMSSTPSIRLIRSEEHTSELQSLMRSSYAVFCLKTKRDKTHTKKKNIVPSIHTIKHSTKTKDKTIIDTQISVNN